MKERDSGFELLRVIMMFFIVASHCAQHSGLNNWDLLYRPLSVNLIFTLLLGSWGQVGVAVFVIISSWFMADRQGIHFKKVFTILLQTWFFCLLITGVFYALRLEAFDFKLLVKELLTPIENQYWFITIYLVFYLTVPLLQHLVQGIRQDSLKRICIVYTLLIPCYSFVFENGYIGGALANFCYLFFVTAYLKRQRGNFIERNAGKLFVLSVGLMIGGSVLLSYVGNTLGSPKIISQINRICARQQILVHMAGFSLFYLFKRIRIGYVKWINVMAKATLGVYILHENILMRGLSIDSQSFLWEKFFHVSYWYENSPFYIFYFFGAVLSVYLCATFLELAREFLIDKKLFARIGAIDRLCAKFDNWYVINCKT